MSYCIIRVAKLRNGGNVRTALEHNTRERPCEKADPDRTPGNEIVSGPKTADEAMANHARILSNLTRQKNAVQAIEYVIACPPEAIEALDGPPEGRHGKFLKKASEWVSNRHGGPQTVISAVIHRDEDSPHAHIIVVPIAKRKRKGGNEHLTLTASEYIGGKEKLRELQTEFAQSVGAQFGLERGISKEKTGRIHRPVRDWDEARAAAIKTADLDKLGKEDLKVLLMRDRDRKAKDGFLGGGKIVEPTVVYVDRVVEKPIDRIVVQEKVVERVVPEPKINILEPNTDAGREFKQWVKDVTKTNGFDERAGKLLLKMAGDPNATSAYGAVFKILKGEEKEIQPEDLKKLVRDIGVVLKGEDEAIQKIKREWQDGPEIVRPGPKR